MDNVNNTAIDFRKRTRPETIIVRAFALTAAGIALFILIGLIFYIFYKGLPEINSNFLFTAQSMDVENPNFGILSFAINTLYFVVLGLLIALPIGIGGALFLSEYSKQGRVIGVIRFTIEILSGLPSIIFGLFGALFFVGFFKMGSSILAGSCTLAIITLPIIIRTTEESLKSVDVSYREAAMSMGVSRFHMIRTILVPCSIPGIIVAVVLAIGRIVGESAALLFTAGMAYSMPSGILEHIHSAGTSLTVQVYLVFHEAPVGTSNNTMLAIAAVLMVIVFILNTITGFIGTKFKKGNNN